MGNSREVASLLLFIDHPGFSPDVEWGALFVLLSVVLMDESTDLVGCGTLNSHGSHAVTDGV